ncbi:MAG: flagellar filament capping protein FliD, partial [Phocaeicola sp.]
LTYEFEFNISDNETNNDVQNKLARLVNRSNIGLHSEVLTDSLGNTALSIASDATGISGIRPTIFNITSDNKELMDTLGLDRVTSYPSNAVFSVNGDERFSTSNEFVINKAFEIKLKSVTGESPAAISIRTDGEAMVDSINELISGYNSLISITADSNNSAFEGNERLKKEFAGIALAHKTTLNNNGLKVQDDGSVAVDRESILNAVDKGTLGNIFSELNDFKKAMQRKADDIATNPMNYVNNKIVAYKNPNRPVTDPYNLSAYTGMMFNGYI